MSDNLKNTGTQDAVRVNVHQEHELVYWCKKWNISRDELRAVVAKVGPYVPDIARELGKTAL